MTKTLAVVVALVVASFVAGAANAGIIAQTTLSGTYDIFAAGLSSITNDTGNGGQGVLPYSLAVTGLEQVYVTTSGKVWCCDGNGGVPPSTAHGSDTNPFSGFGPGSNITNIVAGSTVGNYSSPTGGIFELLYTFTDASGTDIGGLNHLSSNGTSGFITAPSNAAHIYFGFADGFGFNNDSGAYSDNVNDAAAGAPGILLTISSAPEPAVWALMLLGAGLTGGALRRVGRQPARSRAAAQFARPP